MRISQDVKSEITKILSKIESMSGVVYTHPAILVPRGHRKDWPNHFRIGNMRIRVMSLDNFPDCKLLCESNEVLLVGLKDV